MSNIDSDRALLERLGLSQQQAADLLGRTRQAVNAALGGDSQRQGYFKPSDILALRLAASGLGHAFEDHEVLRYVERCFGLDGRRAVETGFGGLAAQGIPSPAGDLLILLPDYRHLKREEAFANAHQMVLDLSYQPGCRSVTYWCNSEFERNTLGEDLLEREKVKGSPTADVFIACGAFAASQITGAIRNPEGARPEVYALRPLGFEKIALLDASSFARHVLAATQRVDPPVEILFPQRKKKG